MRPKGYTCDCKNGFLDDTDCRYSVCTHVKNSGDQLGDDACKPGTCLAMPDDETNYPTGYRCDCPPMWTGQHCDVHVQCDTYTYTDSNGNETTHAQPCQNGGTCKQTLEAPYYECECPVSHLGKFHCAEPICQSQLYRENPEICGIRGCREISTAEKDALEASGMLAIVPNFGQATNQKLEDLYGRAFICDNCPAGWSGEKCEINVCDEFATNPCKYTEDGRGYDWVGILIDYYKKCQKLIVWCGAVLTFFSFLILGRKPSQVNLLDWRFYK